MSERPTDRRARRGRGAFTIIEVLATLVLATIILPAAIDGILLCLATAGHARQQAEAASLAQSKLAELVATGEFYDADLEGDFGEDWPEYSWFAQLDEWPEDVRLLQLDVAVTWTRRGEERYVALSTLIYPGTSNE